MSAGDLFKAGQLTEAIDAQVADVKAHPADASKRLFLFELLAFAGDLDRARRQIDAVRYDEPEREAAVAAYRKVLEAEQQRRRFFSEGLTPHFLTEPPTHVRVRLEAALGPLRERRAAEASQLLSEAQAATPDVAGMLNGKPYSSIRDADDLWGTVLEVLADGRYFWVPLEQVESLAMNPPQFARDLLWIPARLTVGGGPSGSVFLPALYPGSHAHSDDAVKLGRMTDWDTVEGVAIGSGLRTFIADDDPLSILEWRELQVVSAA